MLRIVEMRLISCTCRRTMSWRSGAARWPHFPKTQTVVGATPLLQRFKSQLSRTIVRRHTRENRPNVDMLVVAWLAANDNMCNKCVLSTYDHLTPYSLYWCQQWWWKWERFLAAAVVSDKLDTYLCWDELEQNNNKKVQLLSSYTLFPNLPW